MVRPDAALLAPARYPFACEIGTRFADVDINRHLNNVALAAMIEESRVRLNSAARLPETLGDHGAMVASLAIDYLAQGYYPQPVDGYGAIEAFGRSSWTTVQLLVQDNRVVVFARSVLVCIRDGAAAPLPDAVRAGFAPMMLR
jgi:acyl-CoA thioester hydrolase